MAAAASALVTVGFFFLLIGFSIVVAALFSAFFPPLWSASSKTRYVGIENSFRVMIILIAYVRLLDSDPATAGAGRRGLSQLPFGVATGAVRTIIRVLSPD